MLQVRILWLTLFSVYFILELSIVLVLELLYICGSGFKIYSVAGPATFTNHADSDAVTQFTMMTPTGLDAVRSSSHCHLLMGSCSCSHTTECLYLAGLPIISFQNEMSRLVQVVVLHSLHLSLFNLPTTAKAPSPSPPTSCHAVLISPCGPDLRNAARPC